MIAALALMLAAGSGCGDDSPEPTTKKPKRSKAVGDCAGAECRVKVTCKSGRVYVRTGPAPVRIRTSNSLLRTTIIADFAGSKDDSVIRC